MTQSLTCFKAYDIRGRMPDQLNADVAYRVGRAYAQFLQPKQVVVGHDIRLSSPELTGALIEGLRDSGVDVIHIGECGTEEVYFATFHLKVDGGVCVTASHNPKDYNGMKLVREDARPISGDTGLLEIQALAEANQFAPVSERGVLEYLDNRNDYVQHLLTYVDREVLRPLKVVVNAGNGGAGLALDAIESFLPFELIKVHHKPDGHFPHGVPNPLLEENRSATADAVNKHQADLGLAWDGDFDRCFFFDAKGRFLEGYYLVGLLSEVFLLKQPGGKVVHDPRLIWNTQATAERLNGEAIQSKTGHAFIKERMRIEDAIYGGEMSAHHYFRDFSYCDSGMIPWLLVTELMCRTGKTLANLVDDCIERFPCSGEINSVIENPPTAIKAIEKRFSESALELDYTDGLSMSFDDWRFNLRMSNTEPVVRLNVESRGDVALMQQKTQELLSLLKAVSK